MTTPYILKGCKVLLSFIALFVLAKTAHSDSGDALKTGPVDGRLQTGPRPGSPFKRFVGEWTLKNDAWSHNWGQGTEHIKIPQHHTLCKELNTDNSLLSIVDATSPRGHILWSYNRTTKEVQHLSSFGEARNGVGKGSINENGDLTLKVSFEGEQAGTHRIYTYKWISDDEYEMMSIQYDAQAKPTGLFYGGTFIRLHKDKSKEKDIASIKGILAIIDDNGAELDTKLSVYTDDVIHMAPNNGLITSKAELGRHLEETKKHGYADMIHQIDEVFPFEHIVLMRGRVIGTYHPKDGGTPFPFKTKNLFVFRRQEDSSLKVWQVIFNPSPNP